MLVAKVNYSMELVFDIHTHAQSFPVTQSQEGESYFRPPSIHPLSFFLFLFFLYHSRFWFNNLLVLLNTGNPMKAKRRSWRKFSPVRKTPPPTSSHKLACSFSSDPSHWIQLNVALNVRPICLAVEQIERNFRLKWIPSE